MTNKKGQPPSEDWPLSVPGKIEWDLPLQFIGCDRRASYQTTSSTENPSSPAARPYPCLNYGRSTCFTLSSVSQSYRPFVKPAPDLAPFNRSRSYG
jgi:hypothetical protein